jgi:hypothetical protein
VELLLHGAVFRVLGLALRQVCAKFATNPLPAQYPVHSQVSSELVEMVQSALKGEAIEMTMENFKELSALCDEFGFELESPPCQLARVETALEELRNDIGRLSGEVAALRSAAAGMQSLSADVSALKTQIAALSPAAARSGPPPPSPLKVPSAPSLDSRIISGFPEIFAEFRDKRFSLLWRGSRDDFKI